MSISYQPNNPSSNAASRAFAALPRRSFSPKVYLPSLLSFYMGCCFAVIGCVAIYDAYLVVNFRESILTQEQNPICLALIHWDPVYFSWFILFKAMGACGVLAILFALAKFKISYGVIAISAIALFQIGLVIYLQFADSIKGSPIRALLDQII